jgi:hypothetical protein
MAVGARRPPGSAPITGGTVTRQSAALNGGDVRLDKIHGGHAE